MSCRVRANRTADGARIQQRPGSNLRDVRVAVLFALLLAACGRVGLSLPDASGFTAAHDDQGRLVVAVTRDGRVLHAGKTVTLDELAAIIEKEEDPKVVLRVDADAIWCHVQWTLAVADEKTYEPVGLIVEKGGGERTLVAYCDQSDPMFQYTRYSSATRVSVRVATDGLYGVGARETRSLRQVQAWVDDIGKLAPPAVFALEAQLRAPAIECLKVLHAFFEVGEKAVLTAVAAPHPWVRAQRRLPDPRSDGWLAQWIFHLEFSSKDVAPMTLPVASMAADDKDDDPDDRLIINLDSKGRLLSHGKPRSLNDTRKILDEAKRVYHLKQKAKGKSGYERVPGGRELSSLFVLLRADKDTPWLHVKWVLSLLEEESLFKLQFAVSKFADLSWPEAEAKALGLTRRDKIPWVYKTLDAKLQCFLRTAPFDAHDQFIDVDATSDLGSLRKKIEARFAELLKIEDSAISGRIDAPDTMPLKRVIAVINAFHEAAIERVHFLGIERAPCEVWDRLALPR